MAIDIDRIMKQSQRAVCGVFERQINVKAENVELIKKALKKEGQFIVGTGKAGSGRKLIWYNPSGANL